MQLPISKIEAFAARGLSEQQIADVIDIDITEISADRELLVTFRTAIRKGRAKGHADIANALYKKAIQGDAQAASFFNGKDKTD